ncbi:MAG: HEAT repeat domain-containing protein [Ruminococcus sp.]|nr:HEAT repeat domain-containing protein [Ruminococcus sp.]MBQ4262537.1 HEAT repeat domain-containing protein [Ruminococcus sp.]MDO4891681.1 HEAT repeat domain-containing protein [Eubacteriales bacterium]
MTYEIISIIALLLCLLIIGIEYIFHYRLAEIQDDNIARLDGIRRRLKMRVEGVLFAPTDRCRADEITSLVKEIDGDFEVYELSIEAMRQYRDQSGDEGVDVIIDEVNEQAKPVEIYAEMLENGNVYRKSYACRRLSDLGASQYRDELRKYVDSKNRDLAYNAAMGLAKFGDTDVVAEYLLSIQDDRMYSARIVNEFFDVFSGDRVELASRLFETCNPYMKNTIIKAIAHFRLDAFRPMYLSGATGNNQQHKIACIKALAEFGYEEDEQILQMAAKDRDWVIRSSAVRGLSRLNTRTALNTVKRALSDKEWWVRHTAADSIIKMNVSPRDLEDILGGYDRFAADAVKNVLYRMIE